MQQIVYYLHKVYWVICCKDLYSAFSSKMIIYSHWYTYLKHVKNVKHKIPDPLHENERFNDPMH